MAHRDKDNWNSAASLFLSRFVVHVYLWAHLPHLSFLPNRHSFYSWKTDNQLSSLKRVTYSCGTDTKWSSLGRNSRSFLFLGLTTVSGHWRTKTPSPIVKIKEGKEIKEAIIWELVRRDRPWSHTFISKLFTGRQNLIHVRFFIV